MDYKKVNFSILEQAILKKCLMYKLKYLNLKNSFTKSQTGGDIIECPRGTVNMSLFVDSKECNNVKARGEVRLDNINQADIELAKGKGYKIENLHHNCYIKEGFMDLKEIVINFNDSLPLDKSRDLTVATYNIMGIDRKPEQIWLIEKRMPLIAKTINKNNIDIVCFQEMSYNSYIRLVDLLPKYNIYEVINTKMFPLEKKEEFYKGRGHNIECTVAIKKGMKPSKIIIEPLGGNIDYTNSLMIIEFPNLILYNCYIQAGTKFSPGLNDMYIHFCRCRQQLLKYIMNKLDNTKPNIILGDFNIDLNDTMGVNFPEIKYIDELKSMGFNDNWTATNKGNGYTENTDTNLMRWNDKFIEKKTRVDGIFTRGIVPINCILIGDKEYLKVSSEDKMMFMREFTKTKGKNEIEKLKYKEDHLPIFASDHFGVMSTLRF